MNYKQDHIVNVNAEARVALKKLDLLKDLVSRTLFVVDDSNKLIGALTDGDIRRGLLNGLEISQPIEVFMNKNFKVLKNSKDYIKEVKEFKKMGIELIPLINESLELVDIIDLGKIQTILPLSALIMAGGRGERLKPFTDTIPKPMLKIGDKPIIEHNIDRLIKFGVKEIFISVKYLKEQIMDFLGDGTEKGVKITYLEENEPLGTLGALNLIDSIENCDLLVMNSDILTNIDYEDFFEFYKQSNVDMAVASIPYVVKVPYAVLQTKDQYVKSFVEKPTHTYYSNGGIYLMNFDLKNLLFGKGFYNATDLMDDLISSKEDKLVHYPMLCYWLDIGRHEDFLKAQEDIKHIKFN